MIFENLYIGPYLVIGTNMQVPDLMISADITTDFIWAPVYLQKPNISTYLPMHEKYTVAGHKNVMYDLSPEKLDDSFVGASATILKFASDPNVRKLHAYCERSGIDIQIHFGFCVYGV